MHEPAISIENLTHHYGERAALSAVAFSVARGEIFGLLGPNGGGKTTLFRILNTSLPVQQGAVRVLGFDVRQESFAVRQRIGVVFQHPALDKKLTVFENLRHHARLYGLTARDYQPRIDDLLLRLGLSDRRHDLVETLSGGLARRVELAKGLLHQPSLLILDEPSTGLDPGARRDLWQYLSLLREQGVTVLVTTHLMEEAEKCDRIGILDHGRLVALGTPDALRAEIGGDVVTFESSEPSSLAEAVRSLAGAEPSVFDGKVRVEHADGLALVRQVSEQAGRFIDGLSVARPTLEDVFIRRTGHRFWSEANDE